MARVTGWGEFSIVGPTEQVVREAAWDMAEFLADNYTNTDIEFTFVDWSE